MIWPPFFTRTYRACLLVQVRMPQKDAHLTVSNKRSVFYATFEYFNDAILSCERLISSFTVCPTVQTVLSEGGVSQRPVVFVSRPELLNQIRKKLYQLQKESGWVTVFGMAGSGKSVLAAEAVRHHSLIEGETYLTYMYCEQRSINSALSVVFLTSLLTSTFRMFPWRDPLVVNWPIGQTRLTGKDPVLVFPP